MSLDHCALGAGGGITVWLLVAVTGLFLSLKEQISGKKNTLNSKIRIDKAAGPKRRDTPL